MDKQIIIDNKRGLDIIEFVESTLRIKLLEYQKEMLKRQSCLPENAKIVIGRGNSIYIVEEQKCQHSTNEKC